MDTRLDTKTLKENKAVWIDKREMGIILLLRISHFSHFSGFDSFIPLLVPVYIYIYTHAYFHLKSRNEVMLALYLSVSRLSA